MTADMVTCKRCGGALMSREHLALQLEQLRKEALVAARDIEPDPDPFLRVQSEDYYVDAGIEQIVSELRGVCIMCFESEPAGAPTRIRN